MDIKEGPTVTRREVEAKLQTVGDYVKMDYLTACLKKNIDFDTKKYVLNKLSAIYESRRMFAEAAKLMKASADINTTFDGKIADFMKSVDLFVKGGVYDEADISFTKAFALANAKQKEELKAKRKGMYTAQVKEYLSRDKRKHAMQTYEKILTLDLDAAERKQVQQELMALYEKLGKVREYYNLKKTHDNPQTSQPAKKAELKRYSEDVNDLLGF